MPLIWTEPAEVLTHLGVAVYHVYKDNYWANGAMEFHYRTDVTESEDSFDIRDLPSYQHDTDHSAILKLAIERGEITAPADDPYADDEPKKYYDKNGALVFVSCGISDGTVWITVRQKTIRAGTHRIKSPSLPKRSTKAEAQADLDAYALKHGWSEAE